MSFSRSQTGLIHWTGSTCQHHLGDDFTAGDREALEPTREDWSGRGSCASSRWNRKWNLPLCHRLSCLYSSLDVSNRDVRIIEIKMTFEGTWQSRNYFGYVWKLASEVSAKLFASSLGSKKLTARDPSKISHLLWCWSNKYHAQTRKIYNNLLFKRTLSKSWPSW